MSPACVLQFDLIRGEGKSLQLLCWCQADGKLLESPELRKQFQAALSKMVDYLTKRALGHKAACKAFLNEPASSEGEDLGHLRSTCSWPCILPVSVFLSVSLFLSVSGCPVFQCLSFSWYLAVLSFSQCLSFSLSLAVLSLSVCLSVCLWLSCLSFSVSRSLSLWLS